MFGEDMQTCYGKGWTGATVLWQMVDHTGPRTPYEHKQPKEWKRGSDEWDWTSEGYRRCCTSSAWIGECLAAMLMGARKAWGHDAFFDYCDRWMTEDDAPALKAQKALGHDSDRPWSRQGATWDPFVNQMWAAYRSQVPKQDGAAKNLMWVYQDKKWQTTPNAKPAAEK